MSDHQSQNGDAVVVAALLATALACAGLIVASMIVVVHFVEKFW